MSPGEPRPPTSWVRMSFIGSSSAGRGRVGQQGHLAGVLDRDRDVALVLDAVAGHPTGADLAAVGDELPEQGGVLVVGTGRLLLAELANLLLGLTEYGLGHCGASSSEARSVVGTGMVGWLVDQKGGSSLLTPGAPQGSLAGAPAALPPWPPPAGAGVAHGSSAG